MKYSLGLLALGSAASAAVIDRAVCTFGINSSGGLTGPVGQLTDGQARVGSGLAIPVSQFTITNGAITDTNGRACVLTKDSQFQCDLGKVTPTSGFAIGSNGVITHSGSSAFYACPASNTEYNLYTVPVPNQKKCVAVTLTATGCYTTTSTVKPSSTTSRAATSTAHTTTITKTSTATTLKTTSTAKPATTTAKPATTTTKPATTTTKPATTTVKPVTTTTAKPATTTVKPTTTSAAAATGKTCPAALTGAYQFPHLIIPVDSTKPNTAPGTSYNGVISSTVSSIFNFDIPASYSGKTCSLVFLFPQKAQLQTSSFTFSGPGTVDFSQLNTVATQATTYANQGTVKTDFGVKTVTPGTSTVVTTFACQAGQRVSYELKSVGGTSLTYFQDYNPSPIGLYITSC